MKRHASQIKRTVLIAAVSSLCLQGLAGCAQNTAGTQATLNSQGEAQVVVYRLGNDIEVNRLAGNYVNDIYQAKVNVKNLKTKQQDLQYQITWYDQNNSEIGMQRDAWTPVVIYGKDEVAITAMAPSPEAAGFRINIRDLKADKTFKTNIFGIR